nr:MAG TPA: YopX protein [Caudoviricetes sp.]
MSREIKFRIWDKTFKKFLKDDYESKNVIDRDGNLFMYVLSETFRDLYFYKLLKNIEISEYTGLKDKNGKEIYEGDILKYNFPYDGRLKHISPVTYLETQASFGIKDRYENEIPLYKITANNYFEVVGNIYENHKLLEEK